MNNIFIKGDKSFFKSKNAIVRFKKKLKEVINFKNIENINDSDFLEINYSFDIKKEKIDENNFNYIVNIINSEEKIKNNKRLQLKNKIKLMRQQRDGTVTEKMKSMKRTIPKNIFQKYLNVVQKYNLNIPSPDDILNDPEKFKQQISVMSSTLSKVSNDQNADSSIKSYFKSLAKYLDIEPMNFKVKKENPTNLHNLDIDDDTDDDEPPELTSN